MKLVYYPLKTMLVKYKLISKWINRQRLKPLKTMLVKYKCYGLYSYALRYMAFKNNAC